LLHLPTQPLPFDTGDAADGVTRCPACGSADVQRERYARWMVFASLLLLGFPLPFISRKMTCGACRARWNPGAGFPVVMRDG
jgi:hypothetical protein